MRDIWINHELYMRRIPILSTPWFGIRLHGIVQPDNYRDAPHNHPFKWWWSLVLSGGYLERRYEPSTWEGVAGVLGPMLRSYRRGDRNAMTGPGTFHQIVSVRPRTWTLFVHGPRIARWGFMLRDGTYVDADDYRDKETGEVLGRR